MNRKNLEHTLLILAFMPGVALVAATVALVVLALETVLLGLKISFVISAAAIIVRWILRPLFDMVLDWHHRYILHLADGQPPIIINKGQIIDPVPERVRLAAAVAAAHASHKKSMPAAALRVITQEQPASLPPPPAIDGNYAPVQQPPKISTLVDAYTIPRLSDTLHIPVGQAADGWRWIDFDHLTWVLIAGTTRSGKSNAYMSFLVSLLRQDPTARQVQFWLVDFKRVTFGKFSQADLPHLLTPPALTLKDAHALLSALRAEIDRRFRLFESNGVVDIREWNQRHPADSLPYLFLLIDEISDLRPSKQAHAPDERHIAAAAQHNLFYIMSRGAAAGARGAVGSQYPNQSVISPELKAQCPYRLCGKLPTPANYRLVLGEAYDIPPIRGRFLYMHETVEPVQVPYVGLDTGRFDRFLDAAIKRSRNGHGNHARPASPPQPPTRQTPTPPPQYPSPPLYNHRWRAFVNNYVRAHPQVLTENKVTQLARAMADHDGRPKQYEAYKSEAYRWIHERRHLLTATLETMS